MSKKSKNKAVGKQQEDSQVKQAGKKTDVESVNKIDTNKTLMVKDKQINDLKNELQQIKRKAESVENERTELQEKQQKEYLDNLKSIEKQSEQIRNREQKVQSEEKIIENNKINLDEKQKEFDQQKKLLDEKVESVEKIESEYLDSLKSIEKQSEQIRNREQKVQIAEIKRDEGFTKERKSLDDELQKKRTDFAKEITELRIKRNDELEKELEKERKIRLDSLTKELEKERKKVESELEKQKKEQEEWFDGVKEQINNKQDELDKLKEQLDSDTDDNEYNKVRLESKETHISQREIDIENEVIEKVKVREKSFIQQEDSYKKEIERLNISISQQRELYGIYEELKQKLGGEEPEKVLLDLNSKVEEIKSLKKELLDRPTQEMREKYEKNKNENDRLSSKVEQLQEDNNQLNLKYKNDQEDELKFNELSKNFDSLERKYKLVDESNVWLESELSRLKASFKREQKEEEQIAIIESPLPDFANELKRAKSGVEEIKWLKSIEQKCEKYGFKFHPRILKSFHTALKTAEFSPLTILSGVSGTGKSELPRLYSYFGGVNFLSMAVEPNWDSPESMLGFFNSIDNKFDAQPVLRLLAQSQKSITNDYPGLNDTLTLILLDEMNLAHVELYFSDFLSKLELRRGRNKNNIPSIDVKLGAGLDPYQLELGRNVLWAGTMNQDETTKSLSDKVLDRGIEIHFPRPISLERRKKMEPIEKIGQSPLLSLKDWNNWKTYETGFSDDEIKPYKNMIEDINKNLTNVGRALGHRVWQSIEYYMANYPDVITAKDNKDKTELDKAMRVAFEDQLVQKVMPKLRGIETRGKSKTECLDKIQGQLIDNEYSIVDDFKFACEYGYGQFMWNSAMYLDEPTKSNIQASGNSKAEAEKVKVDTIEPEKSDDEMIEEQKIVTDSSFEESNDISDTQNFNESTNHKLEIPQEIIDSLAKNEENK